jgi:hypothetical protein
VALSILAPRNGLGQDGPDPAVSVRAVTLADYKKSHNKGELVVRTIREIMDQLKSPYNRAGMRKSQADFLGNIRAANFMDTLFFKATAATRSRNTGQLYGLVDSAAQRDPNDRLENVILFFVKYRLEQRYRER